MSVADVARVISVSRRTDIPAFYAEWFMNRVRAGFCHWMNPFGGQVYRVSLRPEECLALVFWTRNPRPLTPYLSELRERGFRFYFQYTLNGYPQEIDSHSPPVKIAVAALRQLAELIGPDSVMWRYDPVILSPATPMSYHLERFDSLSAALRGSTQRCYVSFLDSYGKTERNLRRLKNQAGLELRRPEPDEQHELLRRFVDIADVRDMTIHVCCDEAPSDIPVGQAHCIDADIIRRLRPDSDLRLKSVPSRPGCGCVQAVDIGAYDTCTFGCVHCYATNSRDAAAKRRANHNPKDSILWRPETLQGVDLNVVEKRSKGPGKTPRQVADPPTLFDRADDGELS
ncbi:MAG: DUF1848 domain-containing protein [Thermoleophilia bacterium]